MTTTIERLMTVEEVAEYLRVSRALVYRLPIRYSKVASKRRYDLEDVRSYLALHSTRTPTLRAG